MFKIKCKVKTKCYNYQKLRDVLFVLFPTCLHIERKPWKQISICKQKHNYLQQIITTSVFQETKRQKISSISIKKQYFRTDNCTYCYFMWRISVTLTLASSIGKWKQDTSLLQVAWPHRWEKASSRPLWANCSRPGDIG